MHIHITLFSINNFPFFSQNLQPRWSDLDVNQHVNNVKYIGWILEVFLSCVPVSSIFLKKNYMLNFKFYVSIWLHNALQSSKL